MKVAKRWKSLFLLIANYWRPSLLSLCGLALCGGFLSYKLGTITPAFSSGEVAARAHSANLQVIRENPLYAPHKVVQFVPQYFSHHSPLIMRSVSAIMGLLIIVSFYYVISTWYTRRVALLGSLLLASSTWFLHASRLATTHVTFFLLFLFFACGVWLQHSRRSRFIVLSIGAISLALLYIPGMVWFVVPAVMWQRKRALDAIKRLAWWQAVLVILVGLVLLSPLLWAFIQQPALCKAWLGLPSELPGIGQIIANLVSIPIQLIWKGPADPSVWLGRLPLLDWFSSVMLIIGAYTYWFKWRLDRVWILLYVVVVGSLLTP